MKYNLNCNLITPDIQVRNNLIAWLIQNISSIPFSKSFQFNTDSQGYHLLNCELDFDIEETRDNIFNYICQYKENNSNLIGTISKHLCGHEEGLGCMDFIFIGGDMNV